MAAVKLTLIDFGHEEQRLLRGPGAYASEYYLNHPLLEALPSISEIHYYGGNGRYEAYDSDAHGAIVALLNTLKKQATLKNKHKTVLPYSQSRLIVLLSAHG